MQTANGKADARLATASSVNVGRAGSRDVAVVIMNKPMGSLDGLLGRSFLSRFDLAITGSHWTLKAKEAKSAHKDELSDVRTNVSEANKPAYHFLPRKRDTAEVRAENASDDGSPAATALRLVRHTLADNFAEIDADKKVYFSKSLQTFIAGLTDEQNRLFDADVVTGIQDKTGIKIQNIRNESTPQMSIVSVTFVNTASKESENTFTNHYHLQQEDGRWKIDEIEYVLGGKAKRFRAIMADIQSEASNKSTSELSSRPARAPSQDDQSKTSLDRASMTAWSALVRARFMRAVATMRSHAGFARIEFFVTGTGDVSDVRVTKGNATVARAAMAAALAITPLPPPPDHRGHPVSTGVTFR